VTESFRYPDEDWLAVEACLAQLVPNAAALRPIIEVTVHAYLWRMSHFDPRSPEQVAVNACWARVAKHAHALHAALEELEAIDVDMHPGRLRHLGRVVVANPLTPHADYLVWKNQTAEWARLAEREAKGFPKSVCGSNRARGDAVDGLFSFLLTFWVACGGRVGKGSDSPSTRFVVAAVGRILPAAIKLPRAITDFARSHVVAGGECPGLFDLVRKVAFRPTRRTV
jgi:hypothetical protein